MDAIKRMMEKRWMKERKKERKTNPQQQQQHHQTVIATATENKRGVCTEMKTVWLCAEAHHGKRIRPFLLLLYVTIQSKAKRSKFYVSSEAIVVCLRVCVCGVCLCICVFQSETQSRSFIICFQLRFDSLHEQAIYVHDDDSAKLHHLFIILYTYNTVWFFLHILSRYYPFHCFKNVWIASQTVKYYLSLVSMKKKKL